MEYRNHKAIKRIVARNNAFNGCSSDILNINPNIIPKYAKIVSRYQGLIRCYDRLNSDQQVRVQAGINVITKQLTLLLKQMHGNDASPGSTIY